MAQKTKHSFNYWQWRVIIGTMVGYATFYFVRKNFSFVIPGLTAEYGITKSTFGVIIAAVSLIYGVSKLVNGFLADRLNGRWHMVTGLSVSAIVNFLFGAGAMICAYFVGADYGPEFTKSLVALFAVLLIVNNIFQGCGFPPCNRLITHWVPPKELATKMSLWNTSHSIGAFVAAVLSGFIMGHFGKDMRGSEVLRQRVMENTQAVTDKMDPTQAQAYVDGMLQHYGAWQWAFFVPAIIAVIGVIFLIITLRDTPKSVGLPELSDGNEKAEQSEDDKKSHREFLIKKVILNPIVWILALGDFFVYIVRMAVLDWGPTFLQESRGLTPGASAAVVACFEVFGVLGMLAAGVLTDKLFKSRGQRTCVFCMLGVMIFIAAFCFLPIKNPIVLSVFLVCAGFFIYGPQALIGVIASNQVTRRGASSANGIIGFVSYLAPIISGWVFGSLADNHGWELVFKVMIVVAFLGLLTMLSLWNTGADGYSSETEK
ncbi:MAG: MFS transporter [Bacteroidales bacterium]|nr:MFS transporter [Bacteroidales bacterium]